MNKDQWYSLLVKHHVVQDEILRIENKLYPAEGGAIDDVWELLEGLVMCCAVVASRIDQTTKGHQSNV